MKRLLPAIISFFLIICCIIFLYLNPKESEKEIVRTTAYIASSTQTAAIYVEEDHFLYEYEQLTRGTRVISRNTQVEVNDGAYIFSEIELDGESDINGNPIVFYTLPENLTANPDEVITEPVKYVRTSATVYTTPDSCEIASFARKGSELDVCGYAGLQDDGSVEMYKVDIDGVQGYIYSKYLADSKEEADAVYSYISDNHAGRSYEFELYGGSPETLDWYPVTKAQMSSGPLLEEARAMYLCAEAASPALVSDYISLAVESGANAFVVDIKDGILTYASETASELCPSAWASAYMAASEFSESMKMIKDAGLYVIGRIVVFNDDYYAQDHPEECIMSDGTNSGWPSAYSRNCWYYNIALAREAAQTFDFDEIQFDYVRFPETAYELSEAGNTDFRNTWDEEKAEAIQNFCFYAADQLHNIDTYISVDVFGESVEEYVTAYGQYWPAISNVVDVISGMPYTDHFGETEDTWTYPYTTVYEWAAKAAMRQTEIRTPAIARTWITGYDTPNWNPYVIYGPSQLTDQAQALKDSGLTGGFIPWNAGSSLTKYYSYSSVWNDQYNN